MLVTVKVLGGAEHTLDVRKLRTLTLMFDKSLIVGGGGYSGNSGKTGFVNNHK